MGVRNFFALVLLVFFVVPLATSALTLEEIQERVRTLLERVSVLKQQLQEIEQGQKPLPPLPANLPCLSLGRTLHADMEGGDVRKLQEFLIGAGLLAKGNVSGYYGSLTEAAVQRWQVGAGIITSGTPSTTGFGVVGPKTREAIFSACKMRVTAAKEARTTAAVSCPAEPSIPASACSGLWYRRLDAAGCASVYECVASEEAASSAVSTSTPRVSVYEPSSGTSVLPVSTTQYASLSTTQINSTTTSQQYVDVNASYPKGETAVASGHTSRCPQEGWRAYLACPAGGCITGWNICRGGVWVLDSVQQVYLVGSQGPCASGQLWCGIGYGYGCVSANLCVNGNSL